jgi:hypothetical protein
MLYTNFDPLNILAFALIIAAGCYVVVYAFEAIALYTIAKKNGYDKKWMAFVPILNTYYIGVVSSKNKFYNIPAKTISLITAILEGAFCILDIIYYVAMLTLAKKGYLGIEVSSYGIPTGLYCNSVPASLAWAAWISVYFTDAILWWVQLLYIAASVITIILFFQTYSARHYIAFSLAAIIFPLAGVFFFVVRNNKGVNYAEYVREMQARQYAMYQQYNRQNMNNQYNYNPYSGRTQQPPTSNPYEQQRTNYSSAPSDPFDEFSNSTNTNSSSNSSDGGNSSNDNDPFNFN